MAKFGYILKTPVLEIFDEDKWWMENFGCVDIAVETNAADKDRVKWHALTERLQCGDTLVLSKLSNALHGARQLVFFLEFCRVQNIRLVSIHDRIDSSDELFPDTKASQILTSIALLPREANAMRKFSTHVKQVKRHMASITAKSIKRVDRNRKIVKMYLEGYSMEDIFANSGFRSRSSVFRILNAAGIPLNRGGHSGPLGPRKHNTKQEPSQDEKTPD